MGGYFKWDSGQAEVPPEHASTHQNGGDDEISVAGLSGELADAQTPKTHASSHQSGGADAIKLDDLAAPDDNTDLNVSTSKHGLTPKAPNDTTKFLRGDAAWSVVPVFVPLTAMLSSTSWDGDGYTTTSKTLIDLSAVFGAPAGIKAVLFRGAIRDEAAETGDYSLTLSPESGGGTGISVNCIPVNDRYNRFEMIVPCDANGDVYYQTTASGTGTLDVVLQIWGYWT
jgi:hypothetical protein